MSILELHTDGNSIAGLLTEIFATEVTSAMRTCETCGQRRAIGAHRVFRSAGIVLRCPACGDLAATIAVLEDSYVLRLRGGWRVPRVY
jgi:Zn finger protein HypA/HybF involved in hydrogenase expression